jgi:hypothetical protein
LKALFSASATESLVRYSDVADVSSTVSVVPTPPPRCSGPK